MVELGLGADAILAAGGRGTVIATFAKAAYLRLPAGLVALTTPDVPSGPIHVRGPIPIDRLARGDRVTIEGARCQAADVVIDLTGATVWRDALPGPAALSAGRDLAVELLATVPTALADPSYAPRVARAVASLGRHDVAGAVDALAGLGPGLTPAGDDALAGILLLAREPAVVERARTNDISRAFLTWAAQGQTIEPMHRFLAMVVQGDRDGAADALGFLVRFGHSSGADMAYGLRLGFEALVANKA